MKCAYCHGWSHEHEAFDQVVRLDQELMEHSWAAGDWSRGTGGQHVFLWRDADHIRGFALYHVSPLEGLAHLLKIALLPEARGTGEAQAFWREQIPTLRSLGCQRVYLEVASLNHVARAFYARLGFKMLHEVKGFYQDGQNAITMELVI